MRRLVFAAATGAALALCAPAHGQVLLGVIIAESGNAREQRCMRGEAPAMPEQRIAPIREAASATLAQYLALASASETSNVSEVFSRRASRSWEHIASFTRTSDIASINDPVARTAGITLGPPAGFLRAGDEHSFAGVWPVLNERGEQYAFYRGVFRRERGALRLLQLSAGEGAPPELSAYCHGLADLAMAPINGATPKDEAAVAPPEADLDAIAEVPEAADAEPLIKSSPKP